jgi:beta-lactamase superfamily II metal-dependent hydrolase
LATVFWCAAPAAAGSLDLYFIDVELGNAVLVVTPNGHAILFDSGPEPYADGSASA